MAGRGPGCPGGLYAREQRAALRVEGSPVYMKVSAGDQSSSSTVGASEDIIGDPDVCGKVRKLEGLAVMSEVPVLFAAESVLLSSSAVTPDVAAGVT